MSESKNFGKVFQRTVTRTKEKVLRNLGKSDVTIDDLFEEHYRNFNAQQIAAMKFQKELKRYHSNLTEMLAATDSMFRVIKEMYEPTWIGYTEYVVATQHLPSSLEALHLNIIEHLITPFNLYMSQFPEIKAKINKRNRKLMDYDSARHHHESLMSKKTQDTKSIQNVAKELEKTQKIYEDINAEVNKEMADFYNSRVFATATAFNALINADLTYFNDAGKIRLMMSHPIQSLLADAKNYGDRHASSPPPKPPQPSYKLHKPDDEVLFLEKEYSLTEIANNECNKNNKSPGRSTFSAKKVFLNKSSSAKVDNGDDDGDNDDDHAENDDDENGELVVVEVHNNKVLDRGMPSSPDQAANHKVADHCNDANINGQYEVCSPSSFNSDQSDKVLEHDVADKEKCQVTVGTVSSNEFLDVNKNRNDKQSAVETEATAIKSDQTPSPTTSPPHTAPTSTSELLSSTALPVKTGSAVDESEGAASASSGRISTFVPPSRILFKVEATHKYVGEDIDELSFDIGDIITVVPFDNPDDQDDGWLMGIIEKSKEKGVFPQNFTKMIQ